MRAILRVRAVSLGIVALAALLALAGLPSGALAAPPDFHDKIDETIVGVDVCGEIVTIHITGTQVGTFTDTSIHIRGQVTQVFTTEDGRRATVKAAGTYTGTFTDNGDGTFTIVDSYKGLPEKITGAKGGPVLRDAGLISFVTTIDENGNASTEVIIRGPHPQAESDFTLFCSAFLTALG